MGEVACQCGVEEARLMSGGLLSGYQVAYDLNADQCLRCGINLIWVKESIVKVELGVSSRIVRG